MREWTLKTTVCLLVIIFSGFAVSATAQVDVKIGKGKLELNDEEWPLSHEIKKEIEARLMVLPELSELVTAKRIIQIPVEEKYLQSLEDQIDTQLPEIEVQLKSQIISGWKQQDYSEVGESDTEGIVAEDSDQGKRVVMGANQIIPAEEFVQELVVIGGKVDVHGSINSLVIIGGYVILHPQARINKELVLIGGHLEELNGAKISGKRVDMSLPGGEEAWTILSDKVKSALFQEMKDHSWIRIFGFVVKLLILMLFLWLGDLFSPGYQREVERYLKTSPGWSAFWGYLSALLVLPVTLFLTLSLIGIPLLPLQFSLLFIFVIYGEIHIAKYLVSLLPFFREKLKVATFLGLIAIEGLGLLAGLYLLKWAIILVGFGAASKVFYKRVLTVSKD